MSTLTSTSTLAQVEAAYVDNSSYIEDGSVAKCRAFITACRILLLKHPKEQSTREGQLHLNPELVAKELLKAEQWLPDRSPPDSSGGGGAATSVASFRNFR